MTGTGIRRTQRPLKAVILEADPNFYEDSNPANQTAYEFSNGRKFKSRRPYDNYTPIEDDEA